MDLRDEIAMSYMRKVIEVSDKAAVVEWETATKFAYRLAKMMEAAKAEVFQAEEGKMPWEKFADDGQIMEAIREHRTQFGTSLMEARLDVNQYILNNQVAKD